MSMPFVCHQAPYVQLYSDERGVCRVYEIEHRQRRVEAPAGGRAVLPSLRGDLQRRREADHRTLGDREDGTNYRTDFDLIFRRVDT
jgi:hypothetical protein